MARADLTAERLRELLHYDPLTGLFVWILSTSSNVVIGSVAGHQTKRGYVRVTIGTRKYLAHRLAYLYMTGAWPSAQIDHWNRLKSDNKWANLRPATNAQNHQNMPASARSRTGVRGVYRTSLGWEAGIKSGNVVLRSRHASLPEAVAARREMEAKMFTHLVDDEPAIRKDKGDFVWRGVTP